MRKFSTIYMPCPLCSEHKYFTVDRVVLQQCEPLLTIPLHLRILIKTKLNIDQLAISR